MPAEGRPPLAARRDCVDQGMDSSRAHRRRARRLPGSTIREELPEPPLQPVGDYSALMPEIQQMEQGAGRKLEPVSASLRMD